MPRRKATVPPVADRPFRVIEGGRASTASVSRAAEPVLFDNLADYLVRNDETICMYASGDRMAGIEIYDGDLLVIDRARAPRVGDIVIEERGDELIIAEYRSRLRFVRAGEEPSVEVYGVVTFRIRAVSRA